MKRNESLSCHDNHIALPATIRVIDILVQTDCGHRRDSQIGTVGKQQLSLAGRTGAHLLLGIDRGSGGDSLNAFFGLSLNFIYSRDRAAYFWLHGSATNVASGASGPAEPFIGDRLLNSRSISLVGFYRGKRRLAEARPDGYSLVVVGSSQNL